MPRIAIAGFQHETNTFGVTQAGFHEFEIADSWPKMLKGDDLISGTAGLNLPITGFIDAALKQPSVELCPILWCAAEPSAHVTDGAYERISSLILDGIRGAVQIDGLYLDLHGAMVTETFDDGEGELLRRLRAVLGENFPIAISLDLHANITPRMVNLATSIALYRTYPHLDMAETGARCLPHLLAQIDGARPAKAFRQVPYLIPLSAQYTGAPPCQSLYAALEDIDSAIGCWADIALGFTASDIHDTGPSIVAFAPTQAEAEVLADDLLSMFLRAEDTFDCRLMTPAEAVRVAIAAEENRPIILADVQDNPGAGATSDTTGLLSALVDEHAKGAILGLIQDPEIAAEAHRHGIGKTIEGMLGGKSGLPDQRPFEGRFIVETLNDGVCEYIGQMYGGGTAILGPSALLRVDVAETDIRVVVTSARSQCLDLGLFTHFGLKPKDAKIICVKSTVHYRADFDPIAATVISVAAPGAFPCELETIPYQNLRNGVRLGPCGRPFVHPGLTNENVSTTVE